MAKNTNNEKNLNQKNCENGPFCVNKYPEYLAISKKNVVQPLGCAVAPFIKSRFFFI